MNRRRWYDTVRSDGHPRACSQGYVYTHLLVAERALGRPIPIGVEVHHVDGDKRNNAPSNLVICQDRDYHQLLHVRARVVRAGGNPNTHRICSGCEMLKPFAEFNKATKRKGGLQRQCRVCQSVYAKQYHDAVVLI